MTATEGRRRQLPGPNERCKILLVDDRQDKLLALEAILSELGHHIVTCTSGEQALRLLLQEEFAVILLDVRMPVMDGLETATLIRKRPRCADLPIIFVTASSSSDQSVTQGYQLGAVDFIFTPVVPEILRAKITVFVDLFNQSKQIRRQMDLLREISERRVANVESRFQTLLNRLNVGVFRANEFGEVIEANPAFLRLLGVANIKDLDGIDLKRLQLHQQRTDNAQAIRDEAPLVPEGDVELKRADGERIWVALSKADVADTNGTIVIDGLIEDITARKSFEKSLEKKAAQLARSNYELAQFASVASHDLQEPLRMINIYLDMLRLRHASQLPEQAVTYLNHALDGSVRLRSLINDLLTYSQIGHNKTSGDEVDTEEALAEVLCYLQPMIIELNAKIIHPPLPKVRIDRSQLVQLLQNLISNALKFHSPAAPLITITAKRQRRECLFSIADNGIGIDPLYHQHIFELFHRLHAASEYPGTGIGLASCKRIVERCGGHIWLDSAVGAGSTFSFTLPLALAPHEDSTFDSVDANSLSDSV